VSRNAIPVPVAICFVGHRRRQLFISAFFGYDTTLDREGATMANGNAWELRVTRLGIQTLTSTGQQRTYGIYQVFLAGQAVTALQGNICECPGPGDNTTPGNDKRIEQGRYPLWTQFGTRYHSIGYSTDLTTPAVLPMPGINLRDTGNRSAILVHPGHSPDLYLSSIGCLNPTRALGSQDTMDFWESRTRVIALIDSLRQFSPTSFQHDAPAQIPNAWVVITGEPMQPLAAPAV
jgi:hypothetical protein